MHSSLAAIPTPLVCLLHIGVLMPFIISFGHNCAKCWVISAAAHPPESTVQSEPNNPGTNLASKLPYHKGCSGGSCMNLPFRDCNPQTFLRYLPFIFKN